MKSWLVRVEIFRSRIQDLFHQRGSAVGMSSSELELIAFEVLAITDTQPPYCIEIIEVLCADAMISSADVAKSLFKSCIYGALEVFRPLNSYSAKSYN